MAELKEVAPELTAAGYVRPTEEVFRNAGYQQDYTEYFEQYETELLEDVKAGNVSFMRTPPDVADTLPPDTEPTELPPPPALPKQKKFRPSFTYPGFLEEVPE